MMLFILFFLISSISALPNGAPSSVCETMLPFHGGGLARQGTPTPYGISTRRSGNGYLVIIKSPINIPFEGFLLQARDPNRQLTGSFEPTGDAFHTLDCRKPSDALTHSNTAGKAVVEVKWNPNGYEGPIVFNATVARDYTTFWTGVESSEIQISKRASDDSELPPSTRITTTTPPNFMPDIKEKPSAEFDPFYSDCESKKTCFGAPDGCVSRKNCKAVAAVTVYGDRYEMEMKTSGSAAWVGVGLSEDSQMGDDSVVECVKEAGTVKAYMSYTSPRPNLNVVRDKRQDGIQLLASKLTDGAIYCRVLRETKTTSNGKEFDLSKDKYNLLVAAGSSVKPNKVSFHDIVYLASGEKKLLSDVSAVKGASKLLLRLHGAFMLCAWIGTASVGILLARYYRKTWVGSSICGKDLWFAWHRFFMVLTWALTTAGFILIFVELKAWSTERNPHAILGVITTVICFLQPIGAFFRPHPGTSTRPIFNWLHWLGGNVAHIIAIVTIFFAVRLNKAELPEWLDWVLVGYVAFHVVVHLVLSIMGCASERSADKGINSFPMSDMSGSRSSSGYKDRNDDAPYSTFRKLLLTLYLIVIILLVAALIVIAVLAPVEEFWENMVNNM